MMILEERYSISRTHARSHHMHGLFIAFFLPHSPIKKHHKMKGTGDIDGAIAEIERQKANRESLNLQKTADEFGVIRSRLSR